MEASLKKTGFTLIELMIVMVILVILAAFAVVYWPGIGFSLQSQANLLADDIRLTQNLSQHSGQRFTFHILANGYEVRDASNNLVSIPLRNNPINFIIQSSTYKSQQISYGAITGVTDNVISFDGLGIPYTGAGVNTVALSNPITITLSGGNTSITITITPGTGRVFVP